MELVGNGASPVQVAGLIDEQVLDLGVILPDRTLSCLIERGVVVADLDDAVVDAQRLANVRLELLRLAGLATQLDQLQRLASVEIRSLHLRIRGCCCCRRYRCWSCNIEASRRRS